MPEKKKGIIPKFDDHIEKEAHFCWALCHLNPELANQVILGQAQVAFDPACLFGDPNFHWCITKNNQ